MKPERKELVCYWLLGALSVLVFAGSVWLAFHAPGLLPEVP